MPHISDEQFLRLQDRIDDVEREAKSLGRRSRVLIQQAAKLRDEFAIPSQSKEDTDDRSN